MELFKQQLHKYMWRARYVVAAGIIVAIGTAALSNNIPTLVKSVAVGASTGAAAVGGIGWRLISNAEKNLDKLTDALKETRQLYDGYSASIANMGLTVAELYLTSDSATLDEILQSAERFFSSQGLTTRKEANSIIADGRVGWDKYIAGVSLSSTDDGALISIRSLYTFYKKNSLVTKLISQLSNEFVSN